ncbi:MAG: alpha/beta fold hydrolase [Deltaproteobacteria bacterium]|nr:alpha/beta fold hydrolase [Deltaproteobacteria bacterium]MBW1951611.1 alpha/beta fold hydrolase [Deltaproteobacteria bacterium]MBW1986628.1 alpha/beta fold hydrolase [Deltaproteobacteria bacterium]MBW2134771.1 alpha/beta fold hydrolase [Deltaproteobacteria bacterium]
MEEKVIIPGPEVSLEGRFTPGPDGGVVIAHPHPLFGGSMDNNVVWTARQAFQARRWATLRFNFRGVGRSSGTYSGGPGEVDDLAAALGWLIAQNLKPCYLVGYSFGAYVTALALAQGLEANGALLVSPPIAFLDLAILPQVPGLALIVVGDRDELCPVSDLQALLAGHRNAPEVVVISGTDHFFGGCEDQLLQILRDYPLPGASH